MASFWNLALLLALSLNIAWGQKPAGLKHYEIVDLTIKPQTSPRSKWVPGINAERVTVSFSFINLTFHLELHTSPSIYPNIQVNVVTGTEVVERPLRNLGMTFCEGRVRGKLRSYVNGVISDNSFTGIIETESDSLYVEDPRRYSIPTKDNKPKALIYRFGDIEKSKRDLADKLQIDDEPMITSKILDDIKKRTTKKADNERRSCYVELVGDYRFYAHRERDEKFGAVKEMLVSATQADKIFRDTDFNQDGVPDNVGIRIMNITVHMNETDDPLRSETQDPKKALEIFSQRNKTASYCLSIGFTHRNFTGNYLGQVYRLHQVEDGFSGGMCDNTRYKKSPTGYRNTLLISTKFSEQLRPSFSTSVIRKFTSIIMAHALGHSFGSLHDDKNIPKCVPRRWLQFGDEYVMGNSLAIKQSISFNRQKFSNCSKEQILYFMQTKGKDCLQADPLVSLCGNGIRDDDEECDCGEVLRCNMTDPCCNPPGSKNQCRLRDKATCSHAINPDCCNENCQIEPKGKKCYIKRELIYKGSQCQMPEPMSQCDGKSAECNITNYKNLPDMTICGEGCNVCFNGQCVEVPCNVYLHQICDCRVIPRKMKCNTLCSKFSDTAAESQASCRLLVFSFALWMIVCIHNLLV